MTVNNSGNQPNWTIIIVGGVIAALLGLVLVCLVGAGVAGYIFTVRQTPAAVTIPFDPNLHHEADAPKPDSGRTSPKTKDVSADESDEADPGRMIPVPKGAGAVATGPITIVVQQNNGNGNASSEKEAVVSPRPAVEAAHDAEPVKTEKQSSQPTTVVIQQAAPQVVIVRDGGSSPLTYDLGDYGYARYYPVFDFSFGLFGHRGHRDAGCIVQQQPVCAQPAQGNHRGYQPPPRPQPQCQTVFRPSDCIREIYARSQPVATGCTKGYIPLDQSGYTYLYGRKGRKG